jgi:predicted secreted protein
MGKTSQLKRREFICGMSATALAGVGLSSTNVSAQSTEISGEGGQPEPERLRYPAFTDERSKKVIFVAHCVLNQNARINKCAYSPCSIEPVVRCLLERRIGIVQLPCPETELLGLGRVGPVEIYDQLSVPENRRELKEYTRRVVALIRQYRSYGFSVLGVLGIDGSPCCGVDLMWYGKERPGTGAFMEEVIAAMGQESPPVVVKGIQDAEPEAAIALIEELDRE